MIKFLKKLPINMKLTLACVLGLLVIGILYYPLIPKLLNYPPDSINNAFQIEVNYFYYTTQFIAIVAFAVIAFLVILPFAFRKVNRIEKQQVFNLQQNKELFSIIKTCFNFPLILLIVVLVLPPLLVFLGLIALKQEFIFSLKTTFIVFSISSLLALIVYSASKILFENVLKKIKITNATYGIRLNIKNKILLQFLPLLAFTIAFCFLILYSKTTELQGNSLFEYYKQSIKSTIDQQTISSVDQAKNLLETIPLKSNDDSIFIISADTKDIYYSKNTLSDFFVTYLFEFEDKHQGHTYDYYGTPIQGAFVRESINGKDWILGIRYSVFTNDMLFSIIPLFGIVILINVLFIVFIAVTYRNDLKVIADSLSKISKTSTDYINLKLPVISNDEIGDLTISFNKIQDLTKTHINQLHDSQDTLMEKERLASLGQLIGGIAHNLKTPIMSISGAAEGLTDLINEYNASVENSQVTVEDHHAIASDMSSWVEKIKNYTEYMSDVITAVKGQAVNLSKEDQVSFTVEELLKRVNILMKHELKNAIIYLNISVKTDENIVIDGDVNSLVQVINNMISNSIQAYNGKPEQNIDLIVDKKDNQLVISVKDYGPGLPKKVYDKLFKEMITTKGKNGTGLGLYMSYSTIRANFNGNIIVDSEEGKGCTFSIILPMPYHS